MGTGVGPRRGRAEAEGSGMSDRKGIRNSAHRILVHVARARSRLYGARIALYRLRHQRQVQRALRDLFASAAQDNYAIETLINHALGRRLYNQSMLDKFYHQWLSR